jgi:hypothetical protein
VRGLWLEASPGKKLARPNLSQQAGHGVYTYLRSLPTGRHGQEDHDPRLPRAKASRPSLKNN